MAPLGAEGGRSGRIPFLVACLGDRFLLKLPKADDQEQDIEGRQGYQNEWKREVRELGHKARPQSFAGVGKRVDQDDFLQDWKFIQGAPRIVSTPEKYHGREYHAEHQAYVLLIYTAAERKSVSEFVLDSALREAEERLADRRVFTLDAKGWDVFVAALDAPPRRHARLERLFHEPSVFDRKSEP